MTRFGVLVLIFSISVGLPVSGDETPTTEQIRESIQKSIPYIERDGEKWIKVKKCNSCHMIPFMLWSLHEADARGIELNSKRLAEVDDWSATAIQPKKDRKTPPKGSETQAQLLIVRTGYDGEFDNRFDQMLKRVMEAQLENGQWEAGGQLPTQKRPKKETMEVSTMWNLLALRTVSQAEDKREALEQAARNSLGESPIAKQKSAKSSEWYVMRLLLELKWGDKESVDAAREELLSFQHKDGGWGWLNDDDSDALATSPALFALTQSGLDINDESVSKAVRFLLSNQEKDGTWKSPSTRARDKGAVKDTTIYWSTTWAVIGLTQILPTQPKESVASK